MPPAPEPRNSVRVPRADPLGSSALVDLCGQRGELRSEFPLGRLNGGVEPLATVRHPLLSPTTGALERAVAMAELDAATRAEVVRRIPTGRTPGRVIETFEAQPAHQAQPWSVSSLAFHPHGCTLPDSGRAVHVVSVPGGSVALPGK